MPWPEVIDAAGAPSGGAPLPTGHTSVLKFVTSTTSVSPSQWPRESPLAILIDAGRCGRPSSGM